MKNGILRVKTHEMGARADKIADKKFGAVEGYL
jgi:hypothetical protein